MSRPVRSIVDRGCDLFWGLQHPLMAKFAENLTENQKRSMERALAEPGRVVIDGPGSWENSPDRPING